MHINTFMPSTCLPTRVNTQHAKCNFLFRNGTLGAQRRSETTVEDNFYPQKPPQILRVGFPQDTKDIQPKFFWGKETGLWLWTCTMPSQKKTWHCFLYFCIFAALFSFFIFVCAKSGNQYFSGSRHFVVPFCSICQVPQHARHQIESSGWKIIIFIWFNSNEIYNTEHIGNNDFCQNSFFLSSTSQVDAYVDIDVRNSIMTLNYWLGAN